MSVARLTLRCFRWLSERRNVACICAMKISKHRELQRLRRILSYTDLNLFIALSQFWCVNLHSFCLRHCCGMHVLFLGLSSRSKAISVGTKSNFSFSMTGSEMLAGSGTSVKSAVLVWDRHGQHGIWARRGWDWRAGFRARGASRGDLLRSGVFELVFRGS